MSRILRKAAFCICENKDADQLLGNREADQRLCFCYADSTMSLLRKYEISSLQPSSVAMQPGLCGAWSETPKTSYEPRFELTDFLYHAKTKTQISCAVTAELIGAFVFARRIAQFFYFINPKF